MTQPTMPIDQLTLACCDGSRLIDPAPADIERALRRLSGDNWFAIVERSSSWWVQVACPKQNDTGPDGYVLERREGSADHHYGTDVADLNQVITAVLQFAQGDESWTHRFSWRKVDL